MKIVTVLDYDPHWPAVFDRLRAPIARVLEGLACEIEHVGSTSVPGLAAKPVIDMNVIAPTMQDVANVIERLDTLGYRHRGDLGITGREAFRAPAELPKHHLYVCVRGNLALRNHLAVRDYLRAHADAAREYADLKRALAEEFRTDIDGYVEGKSAFLQRILEEAGLTAGERDLITDANRKAE